MSELAKYQKSVQDWEDAEEKRELRQFQLKSAKQTAIDSTQARIKQEEESQLRKYKLEDAKQKAKESIQLMKDKEEERELRQYQLKEKNRKWYIGTALFLGGALFQFAISNFDRVLNWLKNLF